MFHLGADVLSWKLLLKMHGQGWELSALPAAGSELHRVAAGGCSEHTGADRAPSCPGHPALFSSHFMAAREQSWLLRKGFLSWLLWLQLQLLMCAGIWGRLLHLQPLPGRIGFSSRIAADSARGDQLCHRAAQIMNNCAELPREAPSHCWDRGPCVWWSFSIP